MPVPEASYPAAPAGLTPIPRVSLSLDRPAAEYAIGHPLTDVGLEKFAADWNSLIDMAHLAIVGSHTVNGVAKLHSTILRDKVFPEFDAFYPGKFTNITNGITPRRWLKQANPALSKLLDEAIGPDWVRDLDKLAELLPLAEDASFRQAWRAAKRENKKRLARYAMRTVRKHPKSPVSEMDYRAYGDEEPLVVTLSHILDNKAGIGWTSFAHTGVPVLTSASGPGAAAFAGYYDNTDLNKKLTAAMGGCTPRPRKLREDSIRMAPATPRVAETSTGAAALGKMW